MIPTLQSPEIIVGLCSPIGTDNQRIAEVIGRCLRAYGYSVEHQKVTQLMKTIKLPDFEIKDEPTLERYNSRINYANEIRRLFEDAGALAAMCCAAIRSFRRRTAGRPDAYLKGHAYIIDQFKRKEEVEALRQVYGRLFISVSIYSDKNNRIRNFAQQIAEDMNAPRPSSEHEGHANDLIRRDEEEANVEYGQRLRDLFPLSDVFVNIEAQDETDVVLQRFFKLYFGANNVSPTRDEYGMYIAKSAALRSLDLSRQVGAAAFTEEGEVVSIGCNEVPRPHGGTYWAGDSNDARDYTLGHDENERLKRTLMVDVANRLFQNHHLKDTIVEFVRNEAQRRGSILREALVMDLLEFGRIIHAEMSAISDAARLGRALKGTILYCTTFPCHICAKHIIASGIKKVVFIEPYPKSYAEQLHGDSIVVKAGDPDKARVQFSPFIGISPLRFRELFERGKRKTDSGDFREWTDGQPRPVVKYTVATYLENEVFLTDRFNRRLRSLRKSKAIG